MIKHLIMDVDGSLTDGKVYIGNNGEMLKAFSVKDGYAINYIIRPADIEPIIITGRKSRIVENRCRELGINYVYQGIVDKLAKLREYLGDSSFSECAYFGDDIPDIECMIQIKRAGGIVGCPSDAVKEVKSIADYVCINKAGEGALREFSEVLVKKIKQKSNIDKRIKYAVNYLENIKHNEINVGKYIVDDEFYYQVLEYTTKLEEECKLESHKKYVDIQFLIEGEEVIKVADTSSLELLSEYSEENDIMQWIPPKRMMSITLCPDSHIILYPENAHMGCINLKGNCKVKKIIGKLRIY